MLNEKMSLVEKMSNENMSSNEKMSLNKKMSNAKCRWMTKCYWVTKCRMTKCRWMTKCRRVTKCWMTKCRRVTKWENVGSKLPLLTNLTNDDPRRSASRFAFQLLTDSLIISTTLIYHRQKFAHDPLLHLVFYNSPTGRIHSISFPLPPRRP